MRKFLSTLWRVLQELFIYVFLVFIAIGIVYTRVIIQSPMMFFEFGVLVLSQPIIIVAVALWIGNSFYQQHIRHKNMLRDIRENRDKPPDSDTLQNLRLIVRSLKNERQLRMKKQLDLEMRLQELERRICSECREKNKVYFPAKKEGGWISAEH